MLYWLRCLTNICILTSKDWVATNFIYNIISAAFCCLTTNSKPKFACQDAHIGKTPQPLQQRHTQHCRSVYNGNDSAVFKHIIASQQIDVNDVPIMDREENWFERCVKEAVWVRTKNTSLNCNGATRITLSHS